MWWWFLQNADNFNTSLWKNYNSKLWKKTILPNIIQLLLHKIIRLKHATKRNSILLNKENFVCLSKTKQMYQLLVLNLSWKWWRISLCGVWIPRAVHLWIHGFTFYLDRFFLILQTENWQYDSKWLAIHHILIRTVGSYQHSFKLGILDKGIRVF